MGSSTFTPSCEVCGERGTERCDHHPKKRATIRQVRKAKAKTATRNLTCACGAKDPVLHFRLNGRNLAEERVLCCKPCAKRDGLRPVSFDRIPVSLIQTAA